jgi:hypothetical protein
MLQKNDPAPIKEKVKTLVFKYAVNSEFNVKVGIEIEK